MRSEQAAQPSVLHRRAASLPSPVSQQKFPAVLSISAGILRLLYGSQERVDLPEEIRLHPTQTLERENVFAKPQTEHHWLNHLAGEWVVETEGRMGPDQPLTTSTGQATARSLGGLWMIIESGGVGHEGENWSAIMTLGYDPQRQRYLGTFVASMMTHLWLYSGTLDESENRLVLDTEGPQFDKSGMAAYQDLIQRVDDDHWILSSQMRGDDGKWHPFMAAHHRRRK